VLDRKIREIIEKSTRKNKLGDKINNKEINDFCKSIDISTPLEINGTYDQLHSA
jgi:hypothetical protein